MSLIQRFLFLVCLLLAHKNLAEEISTPPTMILRGDRVSESAPHGAGNVYAPEVIRLTNTWRMWYGGQGKDGHDRIHYAESADGIRWNKRGVVLEDPLANHLNDPAVVFARKRWWMFYTRAGKGVTDEIAVAISSDGRSWQSRGIALSAEKHDAWDALSVGRPSVLFTNDMFHMWYDGRKDLPLGAPDSNSPKIGNSQRHVGYATSKDGFHWQRHGDQPVYNHDAGGIHVSRVGEQFVMVYESHIGTMYATSGDGISWKEGGLLVKNSEIPSERFGHVTPFLLPDADASGASLFYGAASRASWDANAIYSIRLTSEQWKALHLR